MGPADQADIPALPTQAPATGGRGPAPSETSKDFSGFVADLRRLVQQLEVGDDSLISSSQTWSPLCRRASGASVSFSEASSALDGNNALVRAGIDTTWSAMGPSSSSFHRPVDKAVPQQLQRDVDESRLEELGTADKAGPATALGLQLRHRARERLALMQEVSSMRSEARVLVVAEEKSMEKFQLLASEVMQFHGHMERSRCLYSRQEEQEALAARTAQQQEESLRRQLMAEEAQRSSIVEAYESEIRAMAASGARARAAAAEISIASAQVVLSAEERRSEHERHAEKLTEQVRICEDKLQSCAAARELAESETHAVLEERAVAGEKSSEIHEVVKRQCEEGELHQNNLERWFSEKVEQNTTTIQRALAEFRQAEATWADRLRKEEERRERAEWKAEEAEAAAAEAAQALHWCRGPGGSS